MFVVQVKAKVVEDNSGAKAEVPILRTENGPIMSVVRYVLYLRGSGASLSTITSNLRSIILLMRYMDANKNIFSDPQTIFQTFVRRLYTGTFDEEGLDPSGLCWFPASKSTAKMHVGNLTRFTDWLHREGYCSQITNSLREASPHEQRLNYTAWFRKNQSDFLGHIKDKFAGTALKKVRRIKAQKPLMQTDEEAICFPNDLFNDFFFKGIGGAPNPLIGLRDKLILLLLHGAGLRCSEALLLWTSDVFINKTEANRAVVRIFNEKQGIAPFGAKTQSGSVQYRDAFLKEKYGRIPREDIFGPNKLGWKGKNVCTKEGYIEAYFFPLDFDRVFMSLWREYMQYRVLIETNHPYAFISFHHANTGDPLTYSCFLRSYGRALNRIGLRASQAEGLSPHGHRHSYGTRLTEAGVCEQVIQKCLHHTSIVSQEVYKHKSKAKLSQELTKAEEQLRQSLKTAKTNALDWETLTKYGFEDIDPYGYFTGHDPKFKKI